MRSSKWPAVLLGCFLMSAAACADGAAGAPSLSGRPADAARLTGGAASLGELAEGIVDALSTRDSAALESYRVTEREHEEILWPELPIARETEHPFPIALAWENIELRNAAGVRRLLDRLAGRPLRSGGATCAGEPERYPTFVVHRDCRVTVVTPDAGSRELQIFRSVVVRDGRYKIIRYHHELD